MSIPFVFLFLWLCGQQNTRVWEENECSARFKGLAKGKTHWAPEGWWWAAKTGWRSTTFPTYMYHYTPERWSKKSFCAVKSLIAFRASFITINGQEKHIGRTYVFFTLCITYYACWVRVELIACLWRSCFVFLSYNLPVSFGTRKKTQLLFVCFFARGEDVFVKPENLLCFWMGAINETNAGTAQMTSASWRAQRPKFESYAS